MGICTLLYLYSYTLCGIILIFPEKDIGFPPKPRIDARTVCITQQPQKKKSSRREIFPLIIYHKTFVGPQKFSHTHTHAAKLLEDVCHVRVCVFPVRPGSRPPPVISSIAGRVFTGRKRMRCLMQLRGATFKVLLRLMRSWEIIIPLIIFI